VIFIALTFKGSGMGLAGMDGGGCCKRITWRRIMEEREPKV